MHHLKYILILVCWSTASPAQDYGWWNSLVDWDGVSHWSEYLTYTPRYFGPNALPIPDIKTGRLYDRTHFELGTMLHFSGGDNAQNIISRIYLPLAKDKVGLQIYAVPIEYFKFDEETRDIRKAREFDGTGWAVGDIYIGTWIQLFKEENGWDGLLTINIKTASGSNRAATRFTDGSGYNFDLSVAKTISRWRPHLQLGFYAWETNDDKNPQNDALSFGIGTVYEVDRWSCRSQLGGYFGYKGDGDKPLVYRLAAEHKTSELLTTNLKFEYGINDNLFTSIGISFIKSW